MADDPLKPPTRPKYNYEDDQKWMKGYDGKYVLKPSYMNKQIQGLTGLEKEAKLKALKKLKRKK